MPKSKKNNFSLSSWLLKKLRSKLIIWYSFSFISLFFYYQTIVYGLKRLWGYERAKPPFEIFAWELTTRGRLILYLLLTYFLTYLFTSIICEYLRNYSLELCRFHLRKLFLIRSKKNPTQTKKHQKEILSSLFTEVELFAPIFTLVPHRIFSAIISILLNFVFLSGLRNNGGNFTAYFILALSLILITLIFFSYRIQTRINQKESKFRYQENILFEEYLQKKENSQSLEKMINHNFYRIRRSFWKKAFSALSYLIIPGLGILFCFTYSAYHGKNLEIIDFVEVYLISSSLQTIFFKVKDIIDNLPEISKGKVYYQTLTKILKKLEK